MTDNCRDCCVLSLLSLAAISLIGSIVCYITFGIMFLVQDYNVAGDCKGSSLWEYVLVAMILACSHVSVKSDKDDGGVFLPLLMCLGIVDLGLAIWGGVELFEKSCDDLSDSNLWKFGLAVFVIQLFLAVTSLIIIPVILICSICLNENNTEESSISSVKIDNLGQNEIREPIKTNLDNEV